MTLLSRTVLIVEDSPLVGLELQDIALRQGWRVSGPFADLDAGVHHAMEDELDFALLDFDLGDGTNSIPIAEALSARNVRYAFATGTSQDIILESLPRATIIPKPVPDDSVEDILRHEAAGPPSRYLVG